MRRDVMKLLLAPAVTLPGNKVKLNGFAALLIAIVFAVAPGNTPHVAIGSVAIGLLIKVMRNCDRPRNLNRRQL